MEAVLEVQHRLRMAAHAPPAFGGFRRVVGEYGLALAICLALLTVVYDLPNLDWNVPLRYRNDGLFYGLVARGLYDHGWHLSNPEVGAPFGLELHDFPVGETWHFLIMKLLCGVLPTAFAVFNVYFFLTFPLTALTSLLVLRHFGIGYLAALVSSILYAFLPFHVLRGAAHIFLSCYYLVPLGIMVALWVWQGRAGLLERGPGGTLPFVLRRRAVAAGLIMVLIGLTNVYYIYFTGFVLAVASLARALRAGKVLGCAEGFVLIAILGAASIANMLPNLLYIQQHGHNAGGLQRDWVEHGGLRIVQLVLPVTNHRVPQLAQVKERFNHRLTLVDDADTCTLGLLGTVGFLALFVHFLRPASANDDHWGPLSRLNLFCVLLGTMGGFGLLVKWKFAYIKDYSRVSVLIAFLSLFALALLLDALARRMSSWRGARYWLVAAAGCLIVAGVLDQVPRGLISARLRETPAMAAEQFHFDAEFVRQIEAQVAPGSAIYQMPYRSFPEGGSYDHVRMYLHATQTRWSFPAMRGRAADLWHQDLAELPTRELLPRLTAASFAGICIDRGQMKADAAASLEAELAEMIGGRPLVCPQGRFVFFSLESMR